MRSDIKLALTLHFFRGIGLGTWIMRRPSRLSVKGGANLQVDRPSIQNGPVSISIRLGYPGSHEGGATPETLGDRVCLDAFRRGTLDIDCKRMVLSQHKQGGERFEGQGYIRQSPDGALTFKLYVSQHNAKPLGHLEALVRGKSGELFGDDAFYELDTTAHDGTRWTAARILPAPHWDMSDLSSAFFGTVPSLPLPNPCRAYT
jgi:hypothetical protein